MICDELVIGGRVVGFACRRGQRKQCEFCRNAPATLQCDEPLRGAKAGATCSKYMCRGCARTVGSFDSDVELDLCPPHFRAHEKRNDEQARQRARGADGADLDKVDRRALYTMFPSWDDDTYECDERRYRDVERGEKRRTTSASRRTTSASRSVAVAGLAASGPTSARISVSVFGSVASGEIGDDLDAWLDSVVAETEQSAGPINAMFADWDDADRWWGGVDAPSSERAGTMLSAEMRSREVRGYRPNTLDEAFDVVHAEVEAHQRSKHAGDLGVAEEARVAVRSGAERREDRARSAGAADPPRDTGADGSARDSAAAAQRARDADRACRADVPVRDKVAHVKRAKQSRDHDCHWPGCKRQVKPAYHMCREHWYRLPQQLRDALWAAYAPGQEETLTPSREYLRVFEQIQAWIASLDEPSGPPAREGWDATVRRVRDADAARKAQREE